MVIFVLDKPLSPSYHLDRHVDPGVDGSKSRQDISLIELKKSHQSKVSSPGVDF